MSIERRKILDMLAAGTITADEADELLKALDDKASPAAAAEASGQDGVLNKFKFLRVQVTPRNGDGEHVNIKIPTMLIKAGLKLGGLVPDHAKGHVHSALHEHGIDVDLSKMDSQSADGLLKALNETSIDVESDKETVKIFVE